MCGRFSLPVGDRDIAFEWDVELIKIGYKPRFNISPTQEVLAIRKDPDKGLVAETMHWWYVRPGAEEPYKWKTFNARDDRILDPTDKRSMFRPPFKKRRCLIVAGGFYEWKKETIIKRVKNRKKKSDDGPEYIDKETIIKHPYHIQLKNRKVFGFAGIWGDWSSPEGQQMRTCAIVTTSPNKLMEPIHDRMPVIVRKEFEDEWLDPREVEPEELAHIIRPYPADEMVAYEVSAVVSNSRNDVPECIEPASAKKKSTDLFS